MPENDEIKCPLGICDGSGIIPYEDNTYSECACRKEMHLQNYLKEALIPDAYLNKTFDDFDPEDAAQEKIVDALRAYVDQWETAKQGGMGVSLISQTTRIGKSHLACALAHAMISKYQRSISDDLVVFVNVTNWIEQWRAFHARFGQDVDERFIDDAKRQNEIERLCELDSRMNECQLLVLDDIGEVPDTAYVSSKLYSVVEYRTSRNKPILVTSNHPWAKVASKYGDDGVRIVDRLREKSEAYTFVFDKPLKKKIRRKK